MIEEQALQVKWKLHSCSPVVRPLYNPSCSLSCCYTVCLVPREGYDKTGYNKHGYDKLGYSKDGYHQEGYGPKGYDKYGYNREGYDK